MLIYWAKQKPELKISTDKVATGIFKKIFKLTNGNQNLGNIIKKWQKL